jgi:hypothetical protein
MPDELLGWMSHTHTHTFVYVHAWAETDVLAADEHPGMTGMPRDGDACAVSGCGETLKAGERAYAVIEVDRDQRVRDTGEAWVGDNHKFHRVWRDGGSKGTS